MMERSIRESYRRNNVGSDDNDEFNYESVNPHDPVVKARNAQLIQDYGGGDIFEAIKKIKMESDKEGSS